MHFFVIYKTNTSKRLSQPKVIICDIFIHFNLYFETLSQYIILDNLKAFMYSAPNTRNYLFKGKKSSGA